MVSQKPRQIVIPREDAVFRMDKNGDWYNEHGKFEHPKIIKYFNAAIKKDGNGYYVHQVTDEYEEKVYFPYEDTALFVLDVTLKDDICLTLNTTDTLILDPARLFTRDDNLYLETEDHWIKFSSRALLKISRFVEEKDGHLFFRIKDKTYPL